ncbi:DUF485 domain-containing protein [Novipirellula aureliae]|uniref:DUF485 domain-containing protein n=1 Tax=Novipirellula aureliae TaxID=2527966 RepID=UPI001E48C539|nr:DUF485 domain-containing protein [Novipirellula aureliae]
MPLDPNSTPERRFNRQLGLCFFAVYLLLYLIYVLTNAFNPSSMETIVLAGLNLAIVYGFGLILSALFLAILYGTLCRNEPIDADASKGDSSDGGKAV